MPSRTTNARIAALATTLVAGVLAAFALRPSTSSTGSAAHVQQQAAEVRTQVIRRTVHIVRHERPPRARTTAGRGAAGSTVALGAAGTSRVPRTGASGSHSSAVGLATGVAAPRTRTSGASTGVTPSTGSTAAPVRTRTSGTSAAGAPSTSGSGAPVRTRASGGARSGGSGAVRTRTSGGDGGGGHDD